MLTMRRIYRTLTGVSNILISLAAIVFTIRYWNPEQGVLMGILILFCVLFPVIQPVMIYIRAAKQVAAMPKDLEYQFDNIGLTVIADGKKSLVPWKEIRGAVKEKGMVILAAGGNRGYMLTDKVLGTQKDAFLEFLDRKLKSKK